MLRNTLKKGELTFTQIVVAVLALIVLVVVIMIFTGNIGGPSDTTRSCAINMGECQSNTTPCQGIVLPGNFSDCLSPKRCCVSPMGSGSED